MSGTETSLDSVPVRPWSVLAISYREAADVMTAIDLAGALSVDCRVFADVPQAHDMPVLVDALILDVRERRDEAVGDLAAKARTTAKNRGIPVIALLSADQIDLVAVHMLESPHQLLCDPGVPTIVAAIVNARIGTQRLGRVAADDSERLRHLNSEVARIAETLARLTDPSAERPRGAATMRERPLGFGMPPIEDDAPVEARDIRNLIRARRMRDTHFAPDLFADPAWDMLLDLFAAELEHRQVSVSSLCIAAAVPGTTALRWIGTMIEVGLFERHADPFDRRRAYIALSDRARDAIRAYFATVRRAGLTAG